MSGFFLIGSEGTQAWIFHSSPDILGSVRVRFADLNSSEIRCSHVNTRIPNYDTQVDNVLNEIWNDLDLTHGNDVPGDVAVQALEDFQLYLRNLITSDESVKINELVINYNP